MEVKVRNRPGVRVVLLFLFALCRVGFAQTAKVEQLGPLTDAKVPEAIRKVLDVKGYRAVLDDGRVACEIWFRQTVPSQGKSDASGALYPQLAASTLVGVISFPQATTDYRGQTIQPGAYTLRYQLIPDDGNHLGVAANPDFLLLIASAADTDPTKVYNFDELVSLSRQATGTRHPGPMSLVQGKGATAPALSKDEEGRWVLSAGLKVGSGEELPFALIVKGTAPQ
jgi:hypothetical protein